MRNQWKRLGLMIGVVALLTVGALTLGAPGPKTLKKCPKPACADTCDPPTQAAVTCQEGPNGASFPSTYECCCCSADAKNRYYAGH